VHTQDFREIQILARSPTYICGKTRKAQWYQSQEANHFDEVYRYENGLFGKSEFIRLKKGCEVGTEYFLIRKYFTIR
jgi:hypothetical protein